MTETPTRGTVHDFPVPLTHYDLLDDRLLAVRDTFYATKPVSTGGKPVFAVRYDFFVDPEDHNHVIRHIRPDFYAIDEEGADQLVMNFLPPATRQAGMEFHFDLSITAGIDEAVGFIVSSLPSEQREQIGGRYVSLYILENIIVFMAEYPPSWLDTRYAQLFLDMEGVDVDAERRALCQIILPEAQSAHATLKGQATLNQSWDYFTALFADRLDEFADEIKPVCQPINEARPIS
jgi:hypothetical protein